MSISSFVDEQQAAQKVATSPMAPPTAAQIAAAKNAIGGLNVAPRQDFAGYVFPATKYNAPADQNVAPYRDQFYEQFTQPGTFATAVPRATDPDQRGTNPFLQNIYQTMLMNQSRPFFPTYNPQQNTFQSSRALAGDRLYGILSAGAARGLL